MKSTRALILAALAASMFPAIASAGESEMMAPLPTLNVWSAGKMSFTAWGGIGKTSVSFTPFALYGDAEPQGTAKYDDKDTSGGLRFAFPAGENLTLEAGFSYAKGKTELKGAPYTYTYHAGDAETRHDFTVYKDKQERKNWELSFGGLYSLASGADSPIRGGMFGTLSAGKSTNHWDAFYDDKEFGSGAPVVTTFEESFDFQTSTNITARVGLSADVHVVRDYVRITPMVGYYYRFSRWRNYTGLSDEGDVTFHRKNHREGGALYGIEAGYRPGGAEGKWEVVFSPYFKSEIRQLTLANKLYDHHNEWVLLVRGTF